MNLCPGSNNEIVTQSYHYTNSHSTCARISQHFNNHNQKNNVIWCRKDNSGLNILQTANLQYYHWMLEIKSFLDQRSLNVTPNETCVCKQWCRTKIYL